MWERKDCMCPWTLNPVCSMCLFVTQGFNKEVQVGLFKEGWLFTLFTLYPWHWLIVAPKMSLGHNLAFPLAFHHLFCLSDSMKLRKCLCMDPNPKVSLYFSRAIHRKAFYSAHFNSKWRLPLKFLCGIDNLLDKVASESACGSMIVLKWSKDFSPNTFFFKNKTLFMKLTETFSDFSDFPQGFIRIARVSSSKMPIKVEAFPIQSWFKCFI